MAPQVEKAHPSSLPLRGVSLAGRIRLSNIIPEEYKCRPKWPSPGSSRSLWLRYGECRNHQPDKHTKNRPHPGVGSDSSCATGTSAKIPDCSTNDSTAKSSNYVGDCHPYCLLLSQKGQQYYQNTPLQAFSTAAPSGEFIPFSRPLCSGSWSSRFPIRSWSRRRGCPHHLFRHGHQLV